MTIPPIGSGSWLPVPQDGKPENSPDKKTQTETAASAPVAKTHRTDSVQISREAEIIRVKQSHITNLQIADKSADKIENEISDIEREIANLRNARAKNDRATEQEIESRIEQRLRNLEARNNSERIEQRRTLDGRRTEIEAGGRRETVEFPDADKIVGSFTRNVRDRIQKDIKAPSDRSAERIREFRAKSREVRTRLERDVREQIAGAVRESAETRPKDVKEAERKIEEIRRQSKTSEPKSKIEDISRKAVNLLE